MDRQLTREAFGLPRSLKTPGAASLSLPVGREPTSIASCLRSLPGLLSALRLLRSFYDSFSKGTTVPRAHYVCASTPLRLINSEPCTAGADCPHLGRHPGPLLPLSPAGGHCALWKKAHIERVDTAGVLCLTASKDTKPPSVRQGYTSGRDRPCLLSVGLCVSHGAVNQMSHQSLLLCLVLVRFVSFFVSIFRPVTSVAAGLLSLLSLRCGLVPLLSPSLVALPSRFSRSFSRLLPSIAC